MPVFSYECHINSSYEQPLSFTCLPGSWCLQCSCLVWLWTFSLFFIAFISRILPPILLSVSLMQKQNDMTPEINMCQYDFADGLVTLKFWAHLTLVWFASSVPLPTNMLTKNPHIETTPKFIDQLWISFILWSILQLMTDSASTAEWLHSDFGAVFIWEFMVN